jgi:hypothetical protein
MLNMLAMTSYATSENATQRGITRQIFAARTLPVTQPTRALTVGMPDHEWSDTRKSPQQPGTKPGTSLRVSDQTMRIVVGRAGNEAKAISKFLA